MKCMYYIVCMSLNQRCRTLLHAGIWPGRENTVSAEQKRQKMAMERFCSCFAYFLRVSLSYHTLHSQRLSDTILPQMLRTMSIISRCPFCYFSVKAEIRVFCEPNFYGGDCGVACIHGDTDDRGHYECHPDTGAKICHENYYGVDCKKKCVPQDNDLGHYFCDSDGKKICRSGVYANRFLAFAELKLLIPSSSHFWI